MNTSCGFNRKIQISRMAISALYVRAQNNDGKAFDLDGYNFTFYFNS